MFAKSGSSSRASTRLFKCRYELVFECGMFNWTITSFVGIFGNIVKPMLYISVSGLYTRMCCPVVWVTCRHIRMSASTEFDLYDDAGDGNDPFPDILKVDVLSEFGKHPLKYSV